MDLRQALDRIEELEEEIRQLRIALLPSPTDIVPEDWRLRPAQKRIFVALSKGGTVSKDALLYACSLGRDVDAKILDQNIFHMRKALGPRGYIIRNKFGVGFEMTFEGLASSPQM